MRDNVNFSLKYYHEWNNLLIYQKLVKNELPFNDSLFGTHDSSWQECPDTGKSTRCYIHFFQGGPVNFSTYVPNPVATLSSESETNAGANVCMAMQNICMLQNELQGIEVDLLTKKPF